MMAWKTLDRNLPAVDPQAEPVLSEAVREKIRSFFPRYETKRAVLLPALHIVQDALGYVPWAAMIEIAELLEIQPADVMDTVSFYTYFWTHPKGRKVVTVCRSLSCELMGGAALLDEIKAQLGIGEHQTTADSRYSLVTEECLAGCDHAPCFLINEKLHKRVKPEDVQMILADDANDQIAFARSDLFDAPEESEKADEASGPDGRDEGSALESTSDVREMREAD